jgi:hypothetical protein
MIGVCNAYPLPPGAERAFYSEARQQTGSPGDVLALYSILDCVGMPRYIETTPVVSAPRCLHYSFTLQIRIALPAQDHALAQFCLLYPLSQDADT